MGLNVMDIRLLCYSVVYITVTLIVGSTGYCLYGDGPDCAFPCHCANKTECTKGCQPTGCATDPLDIPWQGPGCQIGNVALKKVANQTGSVGNDAQWTASMGVDGLLPRGGMREKNVCAHPAVPEGQLPEWGVDLGDIYKISTVIIYNRFDTCCRDRTTMFTIGIRNTSNYEELCYEDESSSKPDVMINITCNKPVIGSYIRFARKGGYQSNVMNFCEFIAIGHRYFDCSMIPCEADSPCSEVTGCEGCPGSYPPDCKIACDDGSHGVNCKSPCGNCAGNDLCDKTSGSCPNGCQQWWGDEKCQSDIKPPEGFNGVISISNTQSSSLEVNWEPLSMIPSDLSQYYGYTTFHKQISETNYTHGPDVPHISSPQATITGLDCDTEYSIQIQPYRQMMGLREYGSDYSQLIVSTTKCENKVAVIASSVVVVVVVLAAVILITLIIIRRRKNNQKKTNERAFSENLRTPDQNLDEQHNPAMIDTAERSTGHVLAESDVEVSVDNIYENTTSALTVPIQRTVPLSQFVHYVKIRENHLAEEYKTLPAAINARCVAAQTEANNKKNRFLNIYPYDDTRVVLKSDSNYSGDYINANYITGYGHAKEYIATQGPRPGTAVDLWRVVWQEKANRIVMVANLEEMGKDRCHQYWPSGSDKSEELGSFLITMESEEKYADYTTRLLTVQTEGMSHKVQHFQFTTWPDKSRPRYGPISLFAFCRKVHAFDKHKTGPLVVHCSAGVGRTGTFIALDILMQQAKTENQLNIYGWVEKLREDRMFMVQTKDQYLFLHDALVEFIKYGDTAYDCNNFERTFTGLSKLQPDKQGKSKLHQQFMIIQEMKMSDDVLEKDGLQECNRNKNRDIDIIPDDNNRPYLSGRENYINAVYMDTFKAHDAIIVTQMPLPNTTADFWRLVCDHESHTIIMLNDMKNADQRCQPYWPADERGNLHFGKIEVRLLKENTDRRLKSLITRDLEVTQTHGMKIDGSPDETVIRLRHFQLTSWPSDSILPPNSGDLLDLMDILQHWQQSRHSEKIQLNGARISSAKLRDVRGKTIIHCLNGGGASGLYCAVSHTVDRMMEEQEVDAFLAARCITRSRPQFINTETEYQFLYKMVLQCMSRYKEYANFQ